MEYIVKTPGAPAALGAYSQAVIANGMVYVSGQIAINPETGKLVNDTVEAETHRVMCNLKAILSAANCTFANVVQARIFISSMDMFERVNDVYRGYLPQGRYPSRICLVAQPPVDGASIEIAVDAVIPGA